MNRKACVILLILLPLATGAGRVTTKLRLNRKGDGKVVVGISTGLDEMSRLRGLAEPRVRNSLLVRLLLAPPLELRTLLHEQGFDDVAVEQSMKGSIQTTTVTAHVRDVRALTGHGGELVLRETPENLLEFKGFLGGALAGQKLDLSALKGLGVALEVGFPGTVQRADAAALLSHSGRAVTWRWTGDKLLAASTQVDVRIVPDIEGRPYYWLALILSVTALVIIGAVVVLRHGRAALKTGSDK